MDGRRVDKVFVAPTRETDAGDAKRWEKSGISKTSG